jgi:hypothetical protein
MYHPAPKKTNYMAGPIQEEQSDLLQATRSHIQCAGTCGTTGRWPLLDFSYGTERRGKYCLSGIAVGWPLAVPDRECARRRPSTDYRAIEPNLVFHTSWQASVAKCVGTTAGRRDGYLT